MQTHCNIISLPTIENYSQSYESVVLKNQDKFHDDNYDNNESMMHFGHSRTHRPRTFLEYFKINNNFFSSIVVAGNQYPI